ncbi:sulfatase-like hydrolase/transferase [Algisphaera agarilytica]|uniref:Choline-sulfatase n=1 Tax=Algisphaera agarilytica TaxID=1385975 RepID=A0A7X0H8K3_9BACT|nr:sulfatase-like hydrolase/transferase [Algisphaera agarilytica]MBB6431243.1 choline-sulfatase [Algisphaera agarilytica]
MSGSSPNADSASPTNVLVFIADDMTYRAIGSLNNPEVETPNLDRLIARGTTFTHAHHQGSWQGAVCMPSRAMLHTGRMLYHCGGEACGDYPLLGQEFGRQGYDTYMVGKWHNFEASQKRSFKKIGDNDQGGMFYSSTFNFSKLHPDGDLTQSAYLRPSPGNVWEPDDRGRAGHWLEHEADPTGYEHSSTRWTRNLIDYLKVQSEYPEQPFLAYCAFHAPHDPRQAPTEYLEKYSLEDVELPPNYAPEHPFDQGDFKLRDEQLAPWPRTEHVVKVHRQEYHAILTHMDMELGRVLDTLDANGQAENTLIVFTADHGLAVGEHGLMGKQNMYDHSVRVPLIFAGPGVPQGKICDALVYQHSVYATVAELTGVAAPDTVQFPSLAPLIRGDAGAEPPHDTVFSCYRHFQRMCRNHTHKLVLYPHLGRWQLFHNAEDPFETDDLALHPDAVEAYRDVYEPLFAALRGWQQAVGDQMYLQPSDYGLG